MTNLFEKCLHRIRKHEYSRLRLYIRSACNSLTKSNFSLLFSGFVGRFFLRFLCWKPKPIKAFEAKDKLLSCAHNPKVVGEQGIKRSMSVLPKRYLALRVGGAECTEAIGGDYATGQGKKSHLRDQVKPKLIHQNRFSFFTFYPCFWWISFLVRFVCVRTCACMAERSDATCIKTSTRPALAPFTQYNRTFIFVDGFVFILTLQIS